jgi:hypothetical protein
LLRTLVYLLLLSLQLAHLLLLLHRTYLCLLRALHLLLLSLHLLLLLLHLHLLHPLHLHLLHLRHLLRGSSHSTISNLEGLTRIHPWGNLHLKYLPVRGIDLNHLARTNPSGHLYLEHYYPLAVEPSLLSIWFSWEG